jgi:hypothetical protein
MGSFSMSLGGTENKTHISKVQAGREGCMVSWKCSLEPAKLDMNLGTGFPVLTSLMHTMRSTRKYSGFLLSVGVKFYKVATNTKLANLTHTAPRNNAGLGSCKSLATFFFPFSFIIHTCIQGLVHFSPLPPPPPLPPTPPSTTFLTIEQYITTFYASLCLKAPYCTCIVSLLTLNSNSYLSKVRLTHRFSPRGTSQSL